MTRRRHRVQLLAVFFGAIGFAHLAGAVPAAHVDVGEWDMGEVLRGRTVTRTFVVENRGDEPLRLIGVRIPCPDCLSVTFGERTVPPGGRGHFVLSFYAKSRRGEQRKTVHLQTSDPNQPVVPILIYGRVTAGEHPWMTLPDPPLVDFGILPPGGAGEQAVTIENVGRKTLTVSRLDPPPGCDVLTPLPLDIAPDEQADIRLRLVPNRLSGVVLDTLTLHTNDPLVPMASMELGAYVATGGGSTLPGIAIIPRGAPVRRPGSGLAYYRAFDVTNRLPVAVAVLIPGVAGDPRPVMLPAGGGLSLPGRFDGSETVTVSVSVPCAVPVDAAGGWGHP